MVSEWDECECEALHYASLDELAGGRTPTAKQVVKSLVDRGALKPVLFGWLGYRITEYGQGLYDATYKHRKGDSDGE